MVFADNKTPHIHGAIKALSHHGWIWQALGAAITRLSCHLHQGLIEIARRALL